MTSTRLSWIPSEKQYLAKKAEFVSTVYRANSQVRLCVSIWTDSICITNLPAEDLIANDQTCCRVYRLAGTGDG